MFGEDNINNLSDYSVILLTGIADNSQMAEYIIEKTSIIEKIEFPDHHNFSNKDIDNIIGTYDSIKQPNTIIITTEKDSTRLKEFEKLKHIPIYVLSIGLTITSSAMKSISFKDIILDDVRKNKSYGRIY